MVPFFSVVIPLYNKENYINATLESVLNQSFSEFEIIIINDGSTDNSIEKLKSFNDSRIYILNTKNQGVSSTRNLGISKAKAKYICLLDADDLWKPFHLKDLKTLIETYPNCGLYCKAYEKSFYDRVLIPGTFNDIENNFFGIVPDFFTSSLIDGIAWTSAVAFPKAIIDQYGGFDINMRSGQDADLWIRIALNEKVAFYNKMSAIKIISDKGNHLSFSNKRVDRLEVLSKFLSFEKENASFKKYMDMNRFSIALERKIDSDVIWKSVKNEIDFKNLNSKQKTLLKMPKGVLKYLVKFQKFLLKQNVYLTAFK
jgi:glycosyltransferase involved in cell wall biosynthesis